MKQQIVNSLLLISLVGGLSACNKQLNVYPTTTEVDGQVIVDAKSAATALNGVYYQWASGGADNNGVPSEKWIDIHEATPSQLSGVLVNGNGTSDLSAHNYNSASYNAAALWTYGYAAINAANGFLKNIAPVSFLTGTVKQQMIGEARFLRAYANSEMLLYFGQYYNPASPYGIILRNEFVTPGTINIPRVSVGEVYNSVLSDLDFAIGSLPNLNTQIAYANVWAAKLLKARILINRGATGDYAAVVALTNDVITNGPFVLEPHVKDLFQTNGLSSKEVILGVQPFPKQTYKYSEYLYYAQYQYSDSLFTLLNGDPRQEWMCDTIGTPYGPLPGFTKYYGGSFANPVATPITENSYAMRLSEAYLLQAEALTLSGGSLTQAKTLVKAVQTAAGVTDFTQIDAASDPATLQYLIVLEEMRSFAGEAGQDWFAVRRLPLATVTALIPTLGSKDLYILPIPNSEILANSTMKQNPNY